MTKRRPKSPKVALAIVRLRSYLKLTQAQLAESIGVAPNTVARWEAGALPDRRRLASLEILAENYQDVLEELAEAARAWGPEDHRSENIALSRAGTAMVNRIGQDWAAMNELRQILQEIILSDLPRVYAQHPASRDEVWAISEKLRRSLDLVTPPSEGIRRLSPKDFNVLLEGASFPQDENESD